MRGFLTWKTAAAVDIRGIARGESSQQILTDKASNRLTTRVVHPAPEEVDAIYLDSNYGTRGGGS